MNTPIGNARAEAHALREILAEVDSAAAVAIAQRVDRMIEIIAAEDRRIIDAIRDRAQLLVLWLERDYE